MLKLNSNYAKSYMRDNPNSQTDRLKSTNTQKYQISSYDYQPPKRHLQDPDYRRQKFDYKPNASTQLKGEYTNSNDVRMNKEKIYGYNYHNGDDYRNQEINQRQDYVEYTRKGRNFDEPLGDIDSNYRDITSRNLNTKRNNFTPTYDIEPSNQYNQNYEIELKIKPTINESNFGLDRKDYVKHTKRNEDTKTRIMKDFSNNGRDLKSSYEEKSNYDNYLNEGFQNYRNQPQDRDNKYEYPNGMKSARRNLYDNFDDRKLDREGGRSTENISQYPQDLPLNKQKSGESAGGFDRPYLNQRKQAIKRSIQSTPQKNFKGAKLQPGSAERKNSLIEKSQQLQEKLKKLNMQYPTSEREKQINSCQPSYPPNRMTSRNQLQPQANEDTYSKYNNISTQVQNSPTPNRSSSCLRNSFRNVSINQGPSIIAAARNADILKARSPILQSDKGNQLPSKGEAIEKISKLNQKINERIQSIISNYAKN